MQSNENKVLSIGDIAPNFVLLDQDGIKRDLSQYLNKDKKILIYFYPKDDTPGCTTEACNFRDNKENLEDIGLYVFGISKDSVISHKKFSQKYNLNFPILSDENLDTIKSYNAFGKKKFMGKEYEGVLRKSFLLDTKGVIIKIYQDVKVKDHVGEVVIDSKS